VRASSAGGATAALAALAVSVAGCGATDASALAVRVQSHPTVARNVSVKFGAKPLPGGGYYYAVIVLTHYRAYTHSSPPPCATSSNMLRTDYGYPHAGEVALVLAPARSHTGHWCRGGSYSGALYAVPHAPPCEGSYPCRSEPYAPPSPCWGNDGHIVCGVVIRPSEWSFPSGLPTPLAKGARIVAHFAVRFPG